MEEQQLILIKKAKIKIKEARQTGVKKLNLRGHALNLIPMNLFELTQLEELNLGDGKNMNNKIENQIWHLPESIGKLTNLKRLSVCSNQLTSLPNSIGNLTNLEYLALCSNPLSELPTSITKLKNLTFLDLYGSQLRHLPENMGKLRSLQTLNLGGDAIMSNNLDSLPESITDLTNLTKLSLRNNLLNSLPESIGRLVNLEILDLGGDITQSNNLSSLPESIGELSNLKTLNLSHNQLSSLPKSITKLTSLVKLDLSGNQFNNLPENITKLSKLIELDLSFNQLNSLSESIAKLTNLIELNLRGNQLNSLPKSIRQLTNLAKLDLSKNQLSDLSAVITQLISLFNLTELYLRYSHFNSLPENIGKLTNLALLDLSSNQLRSLPENIGKLSDLTSLILPFNQLSSLPESIGELQKLKTLDLQFNPLKSLPKGIARLVNLTRLELAQHSLITPPPEVANKGFKAIRNYFEELAKSSVKLYEAKMLLIGQGVVGKTSLKYKLIDPDFDIQSITEDDRTHGIEIDQWPVTCELENESKDITLNIWDFGGQEIYHATHQFFLTKRSLYILLGDTTRKDNQFKYWLNVVNLLGGDAPVLVVMNKVDLQPAQLNQIEYKKNFPHIENFHSISILKYTGMEDLKQQIKESVSKLPHLGDMIPKSWNDIRQELQQIEENYIHYDQYLDICESFELGESQANTLIGYLHDLGNVLHFNNNKILQDYVILNPEWGTEAIYQVLDPQLAPDFMHQQLGRFVMSDLRKIWNDRKLYPREAQKILLELMHSFELCFQLQDIKPETYIIPELLPENPPHLADLSPFLQEKQLRFEYRYDFMPKGLMTRFICRIHKLIKDESFWKSGVILQFEGSQAYIDHQFLQRKIVIQISGFDNKRELLAIIRSHFDHIHRSLNNLKVKEMIPCICSECFDKESANFFEHSHLKRAIDKGKKTVECQYSLKDVSVRALMAGIEYNTNVEKIKHLLSKGDINGAFEELKKARLDEHQVISLEGRWNRLVNSHTKGILGQEQYTTESNSIADAILLLLPR